MKHIRFLNPRIWVTAIFIVAVIFYVVSIGMTQQPAAIKQQTLPLAWVPPPGVQQIAGCFATQGFHYARPVDVQDFPLGPIYTVSNGQLTSIEYVFAQEDFAKEESWHNLKFLYHGREVPIQHADIDFLPDLFPVPVYAMHFYVMPHGQDRAIKCQ